jgi:hypothetical protein
MCRRLLAKCERRNKIAYAFLNRRQIADALIDQSSLRNPNCPNPRFELEPILDECLTL